MSQLLLDGRQEYSEDRGSDIVANLRGRIDDLQVRIIHLEDDRAVIQREAVVMVLKLLTDSLRHVASGKMEIPDISQVVTGGNDGRWNAIKARLSPRLQDAVDVFLTQGTMTSSALAAALKTSNSNCSTNIVGPLLRQGLLVRNGRELSLKEL